MSFADHHLVYHMGERKITVRIVSDNKSHVYQDLWNTAKIIPRGKFIALNVIFF